MDFVPSVFNIDYIGILEHVSLLVDNCIIVPLKEKKDNSTFFPINFRLLPTNNQRDIQRNILSSVQRSS
jgi:hypothetical protein